MSKTTLPPHGNAIYPWDRWSNGKVHSARRGEDFEVKAETFRHTVITRARRMGLWANTRVRGDVVTFQFVKREEED